MKPVIGLVGGIGAGKSSVAAVLERHGGRVISGDRLGHEALAQPEVKERLVARWGKNILGPDGAIDRKRVAAIVFAKPDERRALEAAVFPWIERRLAEEVAAARADPAVRLVVLDAAIMLETGWSRVCDRLIFVDAPREERLRRVQTQRGWTPEETAARENAQMPLAEKRRRADAVVDNSGSPEDIARRVETLLAQWGL